MTEMLIHSSPYSGTWYPGDPAELHSLLDRLWESSRRRTGPDLLQAARGFVVPHAGFIYSGTVAAAVYRHITHLQPERVVLMGFCHRGSPPGILIPEVRRIETPLGGVDVDSEVIAELLRFPQFRLVREAQVCDHSLEIQLPLLIKAAPEARIVPLYIGHLETAERAGAAKILANWVGRRSVFVASSDLTHYGSAFHYLPFPVDSRTEDRLRELDSQIMEATGSLSEDYFLSVIHETAATVCGYGPISLLLAILRHFDRHKEIFQSVLDYQTSGEITGDFRHSVSYGALGYFPYSSFGLGPQEQKLLLGLAYQTLKAYQQTGRRILPEAPQNLPEALERRCGVFVTLRKQGQLRGCLGRIAADQPLKDSVLELTLASALDDRRFEPVSPLEQDITIEISILTPMKRILTQEDFRILEHGALLKAKGSQGLLLPQVAHGRNWDAKQFLEALAHKAGVHATALSDPATKLYVFRAQIIQ